MIVKIGFNGYCLYCDICEKEADPGFGSFDEARGWAKKHGYKLRKGDDGNWMNVCPDCSKAEKEGIK